MRIFKFLFTLLVIPSFLLSENYCDALWKKLDSEDYHSSLNDIPPYIEIETFPFDFEKEALKNELNLDDLYEAKYQESNDDYAFGLHPSIASSNLYTLKRGNDGLCEKGGYSCNYELKNFLDKEEYLTINQKFYYDIFDEDYYNEEDSPFHRIFWEKTSTLDRDLYNYPPLTYLSYITKINDKNIEDYTDEDLFKILYAPTKNQITKFRIFYADVNNNSASLLGFIDIKLKPVIKKIIPISVNLQFLEYYEIDTVKNLLKFKYKTDTFYLSQKLTKAFKEIMSEFVTNNDLHCSISVEKYEEEGYQFWKSIFDIEQFNYSSFDKKKSLIEFNHLFDYGDGFSFISTYLTGEKHIYQKLDLNNFPFDKQSFSINLYDENFRVFKDIFPHLTVSQLDYIFNSSYVNDDKGNEILEPQAFQGNEWNLSSYNSTITEVLDRDETNWVPALNVQFELERDSSYYIYKIILPIFILVLISFGSFFIKSNLLESKLTLTVVVFLALIAYIFVIDDSIPKLSYMTLLDYFVMISFIFTAIPNLFAIFAYNYHKKYNQDNYMISKMPYYLLCSYFIIILFTIIGHANSYDNTAGFLKLFN